MIGTLRNISLYSLIADLPVVLKYNNQVIQNQFDHIYDSSSNRLIRSLYAPQGRVQAHWGQFVNLNCKMLVIEEGVIAASGESLFDALMSRNVHNNLEKRFSWDISTYVTDLQDQKYEKTLAHDASMIWFRGSQLAAVTDEKQPITVFEELHLIEGHLMLLEEKLTITEKDDSSTAEEDATKADDDLDYNSSDVIADSTYDVSIGDSSISYDDVDPGSGGSASLTSDQAYVSAYAMSASQFETKVYDDGLYTRSREDVEDAVDIPADVYDIFNLKKKFTYVKPLQGYVKVKNDGKTWSLRAKRVADIVNVMLEVAGSTEYFYIRLNDTEKVQITPAKARVTKLKLICVGMNSAGRPEWDIYDYSGTITIKEI